MQHTPEEFCPHLKICSGCHFGELPYHEQSLQKKEYLLETFKIFHLAIPAIDFISIGENYLRTRLDVTIDSGLCGLYGFDKKIIDMKVCFQITEDLQKAYDDFRKVKIPIQKGSVRLRVGPQGMRGLWLDFANLDIQKLLLEKTTLQELLGFGFEIEIGQKGKSLAFRNNEFKLVDPCPQDWFQVQLLSKSRPLKSLISSFTQPSWISSQRISALIQSWMSSQSSEPLSIAEFGSGIGPFTLPLLAENHIVSVFESNSQAVEILILNASENNLNKNLQIFCDDFHKKPIPSGENFDIALVNPPRSGLKDFVHELIKLEVTTCIYISCFPESLALDLQHLTNSGYQIKEIVIVDQFPQTKHFETCVLLQRIDFNSGNITS